MMKCERGMGGWGDDYRFRENVRFWGCSSEGIVLVDHENFPYESESPEGSQWNIYSQAKVYKTIQNSLQLQRKVLE